MQEMQETWVQSLGWENPLEEEMASSHARRIPRTEEPGRLQTMGSQRVGHDWATEHTQHPHPHPHTHTHNPTGLKETKSGHPCNFSDNSKIPACYISKDSKNLQKAPAHGKKETLRLSDSHCGLAHKGVLLEPVRRVAGERAGFQGDPLHGSKILFCQIVCLKHLKTFTSEQKILQWGYLNYLIA